MIKLLLKMFVPDCENTKNKNVRARYGTLSGVLGVLCNFLLFVVKIIIGLFMKSIAVISDAFNNLADIGTSLVSIISAKMSNKHPDKDHPFGHGRIEYIASLIVSFLIMMVGVELLKSSVDGIINPTPVDMKWPLLIFLVLSVLVKVWMYFYNRYLGKKINSQLLFATAKDSLNDSISTAAVIVASGLGYVFSTGRFEGTFLSKIPYDGIIGACVSLMILWSGFCAAREVVGLLLGSPPDKELMAEIEAAVMSGENIIGVHDLIVHDYGPGRVIASVHAEVPMDCDIVKIHEVIDEIELRVKEEKGIVLVIHMDPVILGNERVDGFKNLVENIVKEFDEEFTIHDFRITDGENRVNMIFDMAVPCDTSEKRRAQAVDFVQKRLKEENNGYYAVIQIDNCY